MNKSSLIGALGALLSTLLFASATQATLIVTAVEIGGDVVFSTASGGSLDLTGLTPFTNASTSASVNPSFADIIMGPTANFDVRLYGSLISEPPALGAGSTAGASSGSGDTFGIALSVVTVPLEYVSGNSLSATSTYTGQTFASLGRRPVHTYGLCLATRSRSI